VILERNSANAVARLVVDQLTGQEIPSVVLSGGWEPPTDLRSFAHLSPIVIYFYPGCSSSPEDEEGTSLIDAAQHRAFRDHQPDLEARRYRAIGVSSQSKESQQRAALASRVTQTLVCDPELQLAAGAPAADIHTLRRPLV
jgi:peroxiredoxin